MKLLIILLSSLLSFTAIGQGNKKEKKITIGYSFSPDYSFRTLKNDGSNSSTDLVIDLRNDIEKAKLGYTTGFNLTLPISKFFSFETGIQYANRGYKTKEQQLTFPTPDPIIVDRIIINYSYQYIGIPLMAKFSFGKTKARFISSAGFITNFLVNSKQTFTLKYSDGTTERENQSSSLGFNKIDISPVVSFGVDYKFTDKMHISAEPTFRYGLVKTKDASVKENLWNAGLAFGISYELK